MSFRVFVVCEDHTLDQYVCVPVVQAVMAYLGKPRAVVKVVTSPRLTGISSVEGEFESIAARYAAIGDLVVFALDRDAMDGLDGRKDRQAGFQARVDALPAEVAAKVDVVLAVEETEVWALWGYRSELVWADVRAERDSKELYFDPRVEKEDLRHPGKGRARMTAMSLAAGWQSLATGCPELRAFETRLRVRLAP